jgi:iron complex outermembrane receptor protein
MTARSVPPQTPPEDLAELSLEQLGSVQITSVSRQSERLADAPAAIYVISQEDIRRIGAHTLPEALRLAPNLEVAQVSASTWAISARGFNNSLGNKLLVLVDGRTVYTPLFSGVFWDAQQLALEDVERIEVISGPGATLWGANAVNGVINVITRRSADTQGLQVAASGGGEHRTASLRYGGPLGKAGNFRAYARTADIEATESESGAELPDDWHARQAGFRADWGEATQGFTLQGDRFLAHTGPRPLGPVEASGTNLLARWTRRLAGEDSLRVQAYLDRTERLDPVLFRDRMEVIDLEFLHAMRRGRHSLLWGGGYRRAHDRVDPGFLTTFIPGERRLHWENLFVQDELDLRADLQLSLGLKFDRNVYTGTEWLPSVRLSWKPRTGYLLWGSLSRAVRAPSRIDREFFLPASPPFLINGGPDFKSETADVLELGFRGQPSAATTLSVTAFHHRYDKLRSGEPQPAGNFQVQNGTAGHVEGIEAWADWQAARRWRLSAGAVVMHQSLHTKPGYHDPDGPVDLGNDPDWHWSLRSTFSISDSLELNVAARGVGALPDPAIPAYTALDASLRWRPNTHLELALVGRNLIGEGHVEFAPGALVPASAYQRSGSLDLVWHW